MEPPAIAAAFVQNSGVHPKNGLCVEAFVIIFTLWTMACRDRLDLRHSVAAEHLSRRLLMIQKAVRRNPGKPNFNELDVYLRHTGDTSGAVFAPAFDQFVATTMKNEALVMKANRQMAEEAAVHAKDGDPPKAKKERGKNGGKNQAEAAQ